MNFSIFAADFASLAQLVEQLIRNEQVVGPDALTGVSGVRMLTKASAFESLLDW